MALASPPPHLEPPHGAAGAAEDPARRRPPAYPRPRLRVRYSSLQPGQRHLATCTDRADRPPADGRDCRCVCHQGYWNAYTRATVDLMYVEDLP